MHCLTSVSSSPGRMALYQRTERVFGAENLVTFPFGADDVSGSQLTIESCWRTYSGQLRWR